MIQIEDLSRIPDPKVRLDRYMELQGGRVVSATDPDIMTLFSWDVLAAENALAVWVSRHRNDCDVLNMNPARIKVYGTILPDRENRTLFDKKMRARNHAIKKASERREWGGL